MYQQNEQHYGNSWYLKTTGLKPSFMDHSYHVHLSYVGSETNVKAYVQTLIKDVLPQTKIFESIFLVLCSPVSLLKNKIFALFGRLKQYFSWFYCSILLCAILLSCGIARPVTQAETSVTASARVIRSGQ